MTTLTIFCDRILFLVFTFAASWCLEVIPALFLRDMYKSISVPSSRTTHYSPMLHNALLALGANFSDNHDLRNIRSLNHFVNKANSYFEIERQKPSISLLQALSVLGNFHCSRGEYNSASMYIGK
jgi:hypothetical protein